MDGLDFDIFYLQVAQSSQYPVDLYFLLDLSWSMNKSRNHIAEMGGDIIAAIKESISVKVILFPCVWVI